MCVCVTYFEFVAIIGERGPMAPVAEEGTLAVLVSLGLALFAALISVSLTCSEQHECLRRGTCFELTNSSFSCAFKTVVTPAGWRLLNATPCKLL